MKDNDYSDLSYPYFALNFTVKSFDPDKWAKLFARAGARFVLFYYLL